GARGFSRRMPGARRPPRAARGSGSTRPGGSASRWAPASGPSRRTGTAHGSSCRCRPRRPSDGPRLMATRALRILVVDDDPAMVGAITALVGTEGHQVITAYDGLT